jgi:hypothetical protein
MAGRLSMALIISFPGPAADTSTKKQESGRAANTSRWQADAIIARTQARTFTEIGKRADMIRKWY